MPAASEPAPAPALPKTWRPLGPRIAGIILGLGLLAICAVVWIGFDAETRASFTTFQRGTVIVLGIGVWAAMNALVRSRIEAHADRLVVVNGYRRRVLEWAQVVAVRLPPGAPWVTLDLDDGTAIPAMGIQGSDGDRAQRAVRELRAVLADRTPT